MAHISRGDAAAARASGNDPQQVDARDWVGWWYTNRNTGLSYLLTFEMRSEVEARAIAQALARAGQQATEAAWAEWRTLAVTVAVPPALLHNGGTYEAQIERRLTCPECTAQKVGNPECRFCHG